MYAAKFKLGTRAAVFRRAGPFLEKKLLARRGATPLGATEERLEATNKAMGGTGNIKIPGITPYRSFMSIPKPDLKTTSRESTQTLRDSSTALAVYYIRGARAFGLPCLICGETENVEMHHIRKISDLKGKTALEIAIIAANRKQIPLCRMHHLAAHGKGPKDHLE